MALELLGVEEGASPEAIRKAWRAMVRTYHPDQAREDPEAATQKMAEINAAFDVLNTGEAKPRPRPWPDADTQKAQARKRAADRQRRADLRETILQQEREEAERKRAAQTRAARLRDGIEKPGRIENVVPEPAKHDRAALNGFEKARAVFQTHPRAQIRAIYA